MRSYFEFKIIPERQLLKDNGLLLKVPSLPQTIQQDYLLPLFDESYCEMNNKQAQCYSFPESNLLLLYFPEELTLNIEQTFRVYNVTNPSYVSSFQQGMIVQTFDNSLQQTVENFEFPIQDPFDYGDILYSKIRPSKYEAESVNVDYEWVFIISNPIPQGGYITAYFPPNYYNLEETSPCPVINLKYGITWVNEQNNPNIIKNQCVDIYKTSTATITDINSIQIQDKYNTTMIVINFEGVKNPSQENWTPYFGITTHNEVGYIIDRKLDIQPIYINRKLNSGEIQYQRFESIPNNGNLLSTYYIDFSIQNSIPQYGQIKIEFPSTEFSIGFSQNKICKIIKPIQTFKSCQFDTNKPIIYLELDKEIKVQFESQQIQLEFPGIQNFNADLKSDVIKITTLYDSLILDESGQEDSNRRIQTVKEANIIQNITLDYNPKNEASFSNFIINFEIQNSNVINRIEMHFAQQFSLLLGNQIFCTSNSFLYSQYDKVYCEVEERIIKIYNLKAQENCPCQVDLNIFNILLPNYEHNNQIGNISMYIYETEKTVSEYIYSIGIIQLIENSLPIEQIQFKYDELEPTLYTKLDFDFQILNSFNYDQIKLITKQDMYLDYYNDKLIVNIDNTTMDKEVQHDQININFQSLQNLTSNQKILIQLLDFYVGFDFKIRSIPEIQFIDKSQKIIKKKLYENLISNQAQSIEIKKQILYYQNKQIKLHEGTYSSYIQINTYQQITDQEQPIAQLYDDYLIFDDSNIQWTEQNMYYRIASPLHQKSKRTFITINFQNIFYSLPPILIQVFHDVKNTIEVETTQGIAIGGFSEPLKVKLEYAPYYQIQIILYALNTQDKILSINPSKLTFSAGNDTGIFYIYSHFSSKNSELNFAFTKKESEGEIYQFANDDTQKQIKIIEGEEVKPQFLNIEIKFIEFNYIKDNTSQDDQQDQVEDTQVIENVNQIQSNDNGNDNGNDNVNENPFQEFQFPVEDTVKMEILLEFDNAVVVHYCVYPRGTLDITLQEIINKKLNYQNLDESIIFGTFMSKNQSKFQFLIENISLNKDQTLKIFPINNQGQIGDAILYNFSTINYKDPLIIYLELNDDNVQQIDQLQSTLQNFLGLENGEIDQNKSIEFDSQYQENIYVSQSKFQFSNNQFQPIEQNNESLNELKNYKNQIQNDNNFITMFHNEQIIEFNTMKKKTKQIKDYENYGMSQVDYQQIQSQQKILQNQKLYQQEEGFVFSYEYQLFQQQQSQNVYRQDKLYFNLPPSQKFLRFFINTNQLTTLQLKNKLENQKYELLDIEQRIKDFYFVNPKRNVLKWGEQNRPYIKEIQTDSITISNIQVKQQCNLVYTINPSIRVLYINKLQPPSLNLLFNNDAENYKRKCLESNLNKLEVKCYRENINFINEIESQYTIYDSYNITKISYLPTNEQIHNGLDPYNIKSIYKGQQQIQKIDDDIEIKIDQLQANTNYTIFMTLQNEQDDQQIYSEENEIIYFVFKTKKEIIQEFIKLIQITKLILILI